MSRPPSADRRRAAAVATAARAARPASRYQLPARWAIPWPCVHEFFSIATHPRIFDPPSTTGQACAQIGAWLESPSLVLIGEGSTHWTRLRTLVIDGKVAGPLVHDARIAAQCLASGVTELWTLNRDFSRFPALKTRNPLS